MKLELKELAPYLPYKLGLWVCIDGTEYKTEFTGVQDFCGQMHLETKDESGGELHNFNHTKDEWQKPILRPLSDLKEDIWKEKVQRLYDCDVTFSEYDSGNNKKEDFTLAITYKMMGDVFTDIIVNRSMVEGTRYKTVLFLFQNHFDVFGLIEKGLAINKNDIEQ